MGHWQVVLIERRLSYRSHIAGHSEEPKHETPVG